MSFEREKLNLCEWMHFDPDGSGFERSASLLLLGDERDTELFAPTLEKRVRRLSRKLDDSSYDYIVIPRLTEALFSMYEGRLAELIEGLAGAWLNPGGQIILAFANKAEPGRLWSGKQDPGYVDLLKKDLDAARTKLKKDFPESRDLLYYPYPSLDYPIRFYSDDRLPKQGEEDGNVSDLVSAGCFPELAPAYLYVITPSPKERIARGLTEWPPVYVRYNSGRRPQFAIRTEILKDDSGTCHVLKEGITPEANAHIESLPEKIRLVNENSSVKALLPESFERTVLPQSGLSRIVFPFVTGQSLSEILGQLIRDGHPPVKEIRESLQMLLGDGTGLKEADGRRYVNPANLDGLFSNVLMQNGEPVYIDCEWVESADVEYDYLRFRILRYWYEEYSSLLAVSLSDFLRSFGILREDAERFEEMENAFQESVHGQGLKNNIYAYRRSELTPANFVSLKKEESILSKELVDAREELRKRNEMVSKEREVHRLTMVHSANLENVNHVHEHDISVLQSDLQRLESERSYRLRMREKLDRLYSRFFPRETLRRKRMSYVLNTFRHPFRMIPLYLTEDGRNRIYGDFTVGKEYLEGGCVHFPKAEKPLVSIVIPVYNEIHYTYACLRSILENTDFEETPYEVLIADDVSTDATKEISRFADNLVVCRNSVNQGFLKNCNQAAAKARGEYIFFLNNDTKVTKNWLKPMLDLLRKHPDVGMTGAKLVYPDGRLQEAGGIIWSDASGWNYGRLQDPSKPEFNYVRETDYISGAAILIRRQLWEEIGGFDERYAPAYFEDSDLAFEVRRHGFKVVYQPASVVIHYEGVSNGTDVNGTGLKHYQLVNIEKFREKWKEELAEQSVNTGNPNPFRARERGQRKKYILVVDDYVPTFDRDAGSRTTWEYLQMFVAKGYQVKFLGDNFQHEEPYTTALEQAGIEVLYGQEMADGIWNWIEDNRDYIDFVYFNRPDITEHYIDFVKMHTRWKCIFYGHDLHFLREYREYKLKHDPEKLAVSRAWRERELAVMKKADISYYPSEVETEAIHRIEPSIRVKAITAYIFTKRADRNPDFDKRNGVLFVGGFGHPPNKDAVLWFIREILPLIHEKLPELVFRIAGSKADEDILALNGKDYVSVEGFVSDEKLHELYQQSRLVVVPLRFGAGVKGKVVEALHEGACVVTTACGSEGIPDAESALSVKNSAEEFADEVIRLYQNPAELKQYSDRAVAFVDKHYSMDAAWSVIQEDF